MSGALMTVQQYQINKNPKRKKHNFSKVTKIPTQYTTEREKQELNEVQTINLIKEVNHEYVVYREFTKEINLTFKEKNTEHKHIVITNGHKSKKQNLFGKVGGLAMSINFPTPFLVYGKEIEESFKQELGFKLIFTTIISTILSLTGLTISQIVSGLSIFILLAIIDLVLGLLPNTVKGRRSRNHSLQAKSWVFVTNLFAIVGLLAIHMFIKNFIPDPTGIQHLPSNVHIIGIVFITSTYFHRIMKYVATANNVKLPKFIATMFKK